MSYNGKILTKVLDNLDKPTKFSRPKNQWQDPGEITKIPSNRITMQGVSFPVYAQPNVGSGRMMQPGNDYYFPGATNVTEYPIMQNGGVPPDARSQAFYNQLKEYYTRPDATSAEKAQYAAFNQMNEQHGYAPVAVKNNTIMGKRSMINPFSGRLNLVLADNPQQGEIQSTPQRMMNEYMQEYGHYQQYNQNPNESKLKKAGRFLGHMATDFGHMFKNMHGLNFKQAYEQNYITPGTTEYEAHRVIQPTLQKELDNNADQYLQNRMQIGGTLINDKINNMYYAEGGQPKPNIRSKNGWDASNDPGFAKAMQDEYMSRPATKQLLAEQAAKKAAELAAKKKRAAQDKAYANFSDADWGRTLDAVAAQQAYGHYGFPFAPALNPMLPPTAQGLEYSMPNPYPFAPQFQNGGEWGTYKGGGSTWSGNAWYQGGGQKPIQDNTYVPLPYMPQLGVNPNHLSQQELSALAHQFRGWKHPHNNEYGVDFVRQYDPVLNELGQLTPEQSTQVNRYMNNSPFWQKLYEAVTPAFIAGELPKGSKLKKQAEGGIHIDPKNKGKFTASAKRAGMGVQEFAAHVLANKEDYSSTQVKRANFAKNASKWHHENGGHTVGQELEVTPEQLHQLQKNGYTFEII